MQNDFKTDRIALYKRITYTIETPSAIIEYCPLKENSEFCNFLTVNKISHWLLMTPDNLHNSRLDEDQNVERRIFLAKDLAPYRILRCVGMDMLDGAHHETGFFVAGISKDEAIALGKKYEQNALLFGDAHGDSEVVWLTLGPR